MGDRVTALCAFSPGYGQTPPGRGLSQGVQALQEENRALEQEVAQLRRARPGGDLATEENARLRSLLELQETGQDLTFTAAWVVARAPGQLEGGGHPGPGTDQGIQAGQCVVDDTGPWWAG
ncbi:MAG: hypothetical protein ACLT9P_00540 [Evtepia gabavorous]